MRAIKEDHWRILSRMQDFALALLYVCYTSVHAVAAGEAAARCHGRDYSFKQLLAAAPGGIASGKVTAMRGGSMALRQQMGGDGSWQLTVAVAPHLIHLADLLKFYGVRQLACMCRLVLHRRRPSRGLLAATTT